MSSVGATGRPLGVRCKKVAQFHRRNGSNCHLGEAGGSFSHVVTTKAVEVRGDTRPKIQKVLG